MRCDRAVNGCHYRLRDTRGTMLRCAAVFGAGRLQRLPLPPQGKRATSDASQPYEGQTSPKTSAASSSFSAPRVSGGGKRDEFVSTGKTMPTHHAGRRALALGHTVHFPWLENRSNMGIPCVHSVGNGDGVVAEGETEGVEADSASAEDAAACRSIIDSAVSMSSCSHSGAWSCQGSGRTAEASPNKLFRDTLRTSVGTKQPGL
ncbi:unnamed protein product [Cercospora beticola]|nr:unnamed protein product [Cercospora beticola]